MTDITQISDEMLRQLWLSEQLPVSEYNTECKRRLATMSTEDEPQSIGELAEKVVAAIPYAQGSNFVYDPNWDERSF